MEYKRILIVWCALLASLTGALLLAPPVAQAVDMLRFENELRGPGAVGRIHGAVADRELYVFTYRGPDGFFDHVEASLVPDNDAVAAQLKAANRHDLVRIHGHFADNPSPQAHAIIDSIERLEAYINPYSPEKHSYEAAIPEDLVNRTSGDFLVHAIAGDGHVLVVEYRDQVLPIYVRSDALAARLEGLLMRNDVVHLRYRVRRKPNQPTHLALDESTDDALTVVESVAQLNGRSADVEGALVLFPKSPEIRFDVFAVTDESSVVVAAGLHRQFTMLNIQDPSIFDAIREKLGAWWASRARDFKNGRNKLESRCLRVRARGVFNQVDANQANAQIILQSADDVTVTDVCQ